MDLDTLRDMNLGELAALAVEQHERKQELEREASTHGGNLERIKEIIFAQLTAEGLDRASVNGYTVSRSETEQPNVKDWDAVDAFAQEHGMPDLRQRRISAALWRELLADGQEVPGIEPFTKQDVNIRKTA